VLTIFVGSITMVCVTTGSGALRAARLNLGWSQARVAEALAALAAERGISVAAPASLKTQLSRWENHHVAPEDHYRVLLCELYGSSSEELGLLTASATAENDLDEAGALRAELAAAAAVDEPALELLRAQLSATAALDHRLGTVAVADSVGAQLSQLERALAHAVADHARGALARLVAAAATLAGRIAVDTCRPATAWRHYETAKRAGHVAESAVMVGCATIEQAEVLLEIGEDKLALELVEKAMKLATPKSPPAFRAWLAASEGTALAASGAGRRARSAFNVAEDQLTAHPPRVDTQFFEPSVTRFDRAALHQQRGHALHVLHDDEEAIVELTLALRVGGGSAREIASLHVDLAHAYTSTGQTLAAREHAQSARELAVRIGSTRLAARLDAGPSESRTPSATGS